MEEAKVERYLLSATHTHGRHKQRVFAAAGYSAQTLSAALLQLARVSEDVTELPTPFGRKFAVKGSVPSVRGSLPVLTIWMLREGKPPPYFVTAYPTNE